MEEISYKCSICGKEHVKLWRPDAAIEPLVCAECAERYQAHGTYNEVIVEKKSDTEYYLIPTGNKKIIPTWTVDETGKIPFFNETFALGEIGIKTDQLIVKLPGLLKFRSKKVRLIPAYPSSDGGFWPYTSFPLEVSNWWENLPTR